MSQPSFLLDAMELREASTTRELLTRACALVGERTGGMVSAYHLDLSGTTLVRAASFGVPPAVEPVTRTLSAADQGAWGVLRTGQELVVDLSTPGLGDPDLLDPVIAARRIYAQILPMGLGSRRWGLFTSSWPIAPTEERLAAVRRFVRDLCVLDDLLITRRTLRRTNAVVEATSDATGVGLLVLRADGTLVVYNHEMERLTGWSRADVRREGWSNLAYPDPEYRALTGRQGAELLAGAIPWIERRVHCKDGRARTLRVMSRAMSVEEEEEAWTIGLFQPIEATPGTADGVQAAFGALAVALGNDLTNTVTPIQGHLELLDAEAGLPPAARARSANIGSAVERAVASVRRVRLLAQDTLVQPAPVDLEALLRGVAEELGERGLRLKPAIAAPLPPVWGDREALRHALIELILRSRGRAGDQVEIEARLGVGPATATLRSERCTAERPMVVLRLHDPGLPLDALAAQHLARPWFELGEHGWALPLAVVRAVVLSHEGALDVDGAQLTVYLPASARAAEPEPPIPTSAVRGSELVWAVDDEDDLVTFVGLALESRGYRARTFTTAESILAAVVEEDARLPDVLVMDVMLATKRGPELLRELRRRGLRAPVVWTSGFHVEIARVPLDDQAVFLAKPFRGAELAAAVRRLLDKRLV